MTTPPRDRAHDNGEFFTPPSIVQTIVNVIEPDHGTVFDPAAGTCGMFVQTSHFMDRRGENAVDKATFFGHEKNETTAKIAQINLAVHGLEGKLRAGNEAITYYHDPHELAGQCDFVMANPPFNVDEVDEERVKGDKRLPFGLPGVNKEKKVSNANYLWLQYFDSYLHENGRAGAVMSSQAIQRGERRSQGSAEDGGERRGGCDDRYPRQTSFTPGPCPANSGSLIAPRRGTRSAETTS